jgi:hypothetical protein
LLCFLEHDAGEVVDDPDARTGYRVVDPLLAAWLIDGRGRS